MYSYPRLRESSITEGSRLQRLIPPPSSTPIIFNELWF
jgi:hypothetical protein